MKTYSNIEKMSKTKNILKYLGFSLSMGAGLTLLPIFATAILGVTPLSALSIANLALSALSYTSLASIMFHSSKNIEDNIKEMNIMQNQLNNKRMSKILSVQPLEELSKDIKEQDNANNKKISFVEREQQKHSNIYQNSL